MKGITDLMQQAQKMQADMQKAQEELAQKEVTGEAAAGLVRVTMNGRHDVKRVRIDDSLPPDVYHRLARRLVGCRHTGKNASRYSGLPVPGETLLD